MSIRVGPAFQSGAITIGDRGLGVQASEIPSTGDAGAGFAYDQVAALSLTTEEVYARITTPPASGDLFAYEDTSFVFEAPDGSYSFQYQLYVDGVATGAIQTVSLAIGDSDTTAPVLTSPTASSTGPTTADGTVSTDEANGTLYWVVTTSGTAPSAAQVQAGQDNSGSAAAASGSQSVSATGSQAISPTGLTADTTYTIHYQHEDAAGNDSTVVSSSSFTTALPPISADIHGMSLSTAPATIGLSVQVEAEVKALVNEVHTATASLNTAIAAPVTALALVVSDPAVTQGNSYTVALSEIAVQTYAGAISSGSSIAASVGALVLESNPGSVLTGVQVAAALSDLDFSANTADVQGGATIGAETAEIALAPFSSGVTLQVQIQGSVSDFSLEALAASVGLGSQIEALTHSFEITPNGVAITLDEALAPNTHALTVEMFSAEVTGTATALLAPGLEFTIPYNRLHYSLPVNRIHFTFTDED